MFYSILEEGQVYQISGCSLKAANKQFSNVKNDYEMTIDTNSSIVLV
jgi:replication factor A1